MHRNLHVAPAANPRLTERHIILAPNLQTPLAASFYQAARAYTTGRLRLHNGLDMGLL